MLYFLVLLGWQISSHYKLFCLLQLLAFSHLYLR